ncbi:MAG TPA: adenylate/guanylate cyclase domain-containing protein [Candidatus Sulfomarinibacteraceae bacterium]|nr:adenylate/guanylate cyclase domain-containing protein [Candidatus Sulfomarinibacteraceae bacterium]
MTGTGPGTPGTLAFLFSDIEGSTRLEQALGTAVYATLRERHRELLRAAFTTYGGQEQGTEGDSFFVAFPVATDALGAALDGQRAVNAEPWPDGATIRVRMGLNAGETTMAGGSLVGLAINRAARIAHVAHGGQILVSEAVRALTGGGLPAGASLLDLGAHRLKDLREPEHLYQLSVPDLPAQFPPLATLDARPNNLPTQLTSFVGRADELEAACGLLAGNRLLTFTGPGGTGKTRLSLQVAATAVDDFVDGVFFVPLETVRDPDLVASRIAGEIGLQEAVGRSSRDLLVEWLAGRRVLLVLDNFEQVLGAGPLVADILRAAPGLKVIVTSRAPLRVSGEQEYPVPGLPVPPDPGGLGGYEQARLAGSGVVDIDRLSTYEAVRLFIARARAVRPDFSVTNENAPAVAAICARLHGMPLAIELAAARVKLLGPDAILARLENQLNLLAAGARDLPARQQTLRGAIAWSYDILDEPHRRLLDRLSTCVGGFDLEAAEAIGGPSSELGLDILDGLMALADQSLLRAIDGDPPRFYLLETIREFAAEMLATRDEATAIHDRHARWFLGLAEASVPRLSGAEQRALLGRLELEHDNIRAVLDRAAAAGDADTAIRLAFAMWRFWQKRGHLYEARRRLEAFATAPWSHGDPVLRARLMEALGGVLWWQADLVAMKTAYSEAVDLWRGLGDKAEIANALYNYAFAFSVSPDPGADPTTADPDGEGRRAQEEALALYEELGDVRGQANVLWGIGTGEYFLKATDAGEARIRRALELFEQVGDVTMAAWARHMLGGALLRQARPAESRPVLLEALRHFHEASDASGIVLSLDDLASQAVADGDIVRAARLRGAARRLTASTGAKLAGFVDAVLETGARPHVGSRLSEEDLARYGAEGAAMTLDEAVAYALEVPIDAIGVHEHGVD